MLDVYLNELLVGTIGSSSPGVTRFLFDDVYVGLPNPPRLSLSMVDVHGRPRAPRRSRFARLPAFFSNALPEGRLRTYLAQANDVDERDEESLLAALGDDLPGALIVRSDRPLPGASARSGTPSSNRRHMHFSLAGVQLKFSALADVDAKGLTIPVSGVGGDYIVKLPSRRFDRLPEAEAMVMTFAARCGITVPEHRLVPLSEIGGIPGDAVHGAGPAYAIKRYDRIDGRRIHQEDFAQVFSEYDKYQLPIYSRIAEALLAAFRFEDFEEFLRRLVFNIAIANGDAHLKNFSAVYPDGIDAQLSPAYDLVPTRRFIDGDPTIPIFRATKWDHITIEEFEGLAREAGASVRIVTHIVNDMVERVRTVWLQTKDEMDDLDVRRAIDAQFATVPLFGGTVDPAKRSPRRAGRAP